jgi:hypothetical protein
MTRLGNVKFRPSSGVAQSLSSHRFFVLEIVIYDVPCFRIVYCFILAHWNVKEAHKFTDTYNIAGDDRVA